MTAGILLMFVLVMVGGAAQAQEAAAVEARLPDELRTLIDTQDRIRVVAPSGRVVLRTPRTTSEGISYSSADPDVMGRIIGNPVPASQIQELQVRGGNRMVTGALIGAAAGLALGVLAVATEDDTGFAPEITEPIVIVGYTSVGAVLGVAVGLPFKGWRTVYP